MILKFFIGKADTKVGIIFDLCKFFGEFKS